MTKAYVQLPCLARGTFMQVGRLLCKGIVQRVGASMITVHGSPPERKTDQTSIGRIREVAKSRDFRHFEAETDEPERFLDRREFGAPDDTTLT
jgi:hypothetical protein